MSYAAALARLGALARYGMRPGLEATRTALERLGRPELSFPALHIAGTNGKGSTAALAEAMLRAGGARTGLYTSPHLSRFSERIRLDGQELPQEELVRLADVVLEVAPQLTLFEAATVMAFLAFAEARVDVAVVECGLGGRLDATNLCRPFASVITHIALDHMDFLGHTLAAIAAEKAGIVKPGVPLVADALEREAGEVVAQRCQAEGAPLLVLGRHFTAATDDEGFAYHGPGGDLHGAVLALRGTHQVHNAALALAATACAPRRWQPDEAARREGLASVAWPGRLETLAPGFLIDAAHNPDGAAHLAASLAGLAHGRVVLLLGVLADKDAEGIVAWLLPRAAAVVCAQPESPRALSAAALAALVRRSAGELPVDEEAVVAQAVAKAKARAAALGLSVVACGSIYFIGAVRRLLTGEAGDPVAVAEASLSIGVHDQEARVRR